jgi:hypothetical protein
MGLLGAGRPQVEELSLFLKKNACFFRDFEDFGYEFLDGGG